MNIDVLQKIFVERLTSLMQEHNLGITELAVKTGIPRPTLNNWLLLNRTPQMDGLCKLADFFGCTVDYLLGREN
jgi:transcriptional regulator with XRE-family HTH domain